MINEIGNLTNKIEEKLEELKKRLHIPIETKEDIRLFENLYYLKAMLTKLNNKIYRYNYNGSFFYPEKSFIHGQILEISYLCQGSDHVQYNGYDVERIYDDDYYCPQYYFKVKGDNLDLLTSGEILGFIIRVSDLSTKENHVFEFSNFDQLFEFNNFNQLSKIKIKQNFFVGNIISIAFDHCIEGTTAYKIDGFITKHTFSEKIITRINITPINQISLIQHMAGIEADQIFENSKHLFYLRTKIFDLTTQPPLF